MRCVRERKRERERESVCVCMYVLKEISVYYKSSGKCEISVIFLAVGNFFSVLSVFITENSVIIPIYVLSVFITETSCLQL